MSITTISLKQQQQQQHNLITCSFKYLFFFSLFSHFSPTCYVYMQESHIIVPNQMYNKQQQYLKTQRILGMIIVLNRLD